MSDEIRALVDRKYASFKIKNITLNPQIIPTNIRLFLFLFLFSHKLQLDFLFILPQNEPENTLIEIVLYKNKYINSDLLISVDAVVECGEETGTSDSGSNSNRIIGKISVLHLCLIQQGRLSCLNLIGLNYIPNYLFQ